MLPNPESSIPFHRKNRRRERPGARTRKALSQREILQHDLAEGVSVARDVTLRLPSEKYPRCACLPCSMDRSNYQNDIRHDAGRAEAEEEWLNLILREKSGKEMEERQLFFGGEVDDGELRRMGILSTSSEDDGSQGTMTSNVPREYSIRYRRTKRPSRPARTQFQLPEYLATSILSDNPAIAPWLIRSTSMAPVAPLNPTSPATQFWSRFQFHPAPQSLPPNISNSVSNSEISRLASSSSSLSSSFPIPLPLSSPSPLLFPLDRDDEDLLEATWDFITSSTRSSTMNYHHNNTNTNCSASTPASEPETWIMLE